MPRRTEAELRGARVDRHSPRWSPRSPSRAARLVSNVHTDVPLDVRCPAMPDIFRVAPMGGDDTAVCSSAWRAVPLSYQDRLLRVRRACSEVGVGQKANANASLRRGYEPSA